MRVGPLKLKVQIFCGDAIAMGPGKADLLDAIDREGSISRAGQAMGMSYRRTWLLVDEMNKCWADKLVETVAGGAANRGARLTDRGREVLRLYRALESEMVGAADGATFEKLTALLAKCQSGAPHASAGSA